MEVIKILLAVFLPPLGAYLQVGLTKNFWFNVIFTVLGVIPGVVHALWLVFTDRACEA